MKHRIIVNPYNPDESITPALYTANQLGLQGYKLETVEINLVPFGHSGIDLVYSKVFDATEYTNHGQGD